MMFIIAVLSVYIHFLRRKLAKVQIQVAVIQDPNAPKPILKGTESSLKQVTFSNRMEAKSVGKDASFDNLMNKSVSRFSDQSGSASPSSTMGLKGGMTGFEIQLQEIERIEEKANRMPTGDDSLLVRQQA